MDSETDGGRTGVTNLLPQRAQKIVQVGTLSLVADTRKQTGLYSPYVVEIVLNLSSTDTLELGAGAVVAVWAHDGSTADEGSRSGDERDNGGDGEEHR